jgi:hypothetical protein
MTGICRHVPSAHALTEDNKMKNLRSLCMTAALTATLVMGISACGATGSPSSSGTKKIADDAPHTVKEGAAFTIGKYTTAKGWKIGNDGDGGFEVKGVTVTNTSKESDTVDFTMKVIMGKKVLASIDCTTDEIEAGQEQDANCLDLGSGKFKKAGWDKITVESAF